MAQEKSQENPIPSFQLSYGTWPGPEPIWGDIHVDLGNGNSPQQREKFSELAAQYGGSIRNVGDKLWADFYTESEAHTFIRDAKVSLQMALPDKEFEQINSLISDYGLERQPLPLRNPVVARVAAIGEERSYSYAAVGRNNNIELFETLEASYDMWPSTALDELPLDKQREVVTGVKDFLSNPGNGLSVHIEKVNFPERALAALMNGDNTGLSDEEVSQVERFREAYKDSVFVPREETSSFNTISFIGKAADSVSLDIINIATLSELRMQKQMADFRDATDIELEVRHSHPYYPDNLDLRSKKVDRLPGNLLWSDSVNLPDNLVVNGSLNLAGRSIEKLPDHLVVEGDLDLKDTRITEIPETIKVKGNLILPDGYMIESRDIPRTQNGFIDIPAAVVQVENPHDNKAQLSPILQQYIDFKKSMPNLVPLFHVSGGYETYEGDAERVGKILNLPVQESTTYLGSDGHLAKVVALPQTDFWKVQNKLIQNRIPFAILEDMNKGKENNDIRTEERSNNVERDLGRDEERDQSRRFHR